MNWKLSSIFYGWWIIAACVIIAVFINGAVFFGFTAFFAPIIAEFGWSYTQVSLAASLRGMENGILAPLLGIFIDRWGSKWFVFAGGIIIGVGLIILSRITTPGGFYGAFVIIAIGISACGPGVINPVAAQWFNRRLGLAMGILAAGFACGGFLIPLIVRLISTVGWRDTVLYLGIASLVICTPLSLLIRHKPEKYGLTMDGDQAGRALSTRDSKSRAQTVGAEVGVKQALKSRTFWHFILAFTLQYFTIGAVITHIMPFLDSVHIDRSTASFFAASIPVISVVGRLGSGWLGDRLNRRWATITGFITITIGTALFIFISNTGIWLLVITVIVFSLSYGNGNTLRAVLLRDYFGKSNFGTIFGCIMGGAATGSLLGPLVAGWIFDTWSSYHYVWIVCSVTNIAALILLMTTPKVNVPVPVPEIKAGP